MLKVKPHILLLPVSVAFYFVSLSLPALLFAKHEPQSGLDILCWGWWGLLTFDPGWLANPAYLVTMILLGMRQYSAALIACSMAVLFGLTSFSASEWWFNEGQSTHITGLGSGFYTWLVALVVAWLSALLAWRSGKGKPLG